MKDDSLLVGEAWRDSGVRSERPTEEGAPSAPPATFNGNSFDLAAMGALASGILLLFLCGTCNAGFYCLPLVPLALGIVGLLQARQAVNAERTRTWSWIGVGIGGLILLLMVLGMILYTVLVVAAIAAGGLRQ